ncbi:uncharacterized protein LOC117106082 [Anneissia japonica]|uniref:uncharacterized protein LOC117106082 n=1 Tax=Anneissia japonica TaxID=1529436 RepID=UPI0014255F51|nr:uncharacterized protein LOC117106082 [Anneissia japonica]
MVLRFHVTYKLAKHVIELQADTGIVSDITEIIYEKFNIQKRNEITLQYYEKDFEDWVNLELNSSLQNMMKLKVEAVVRESSDSEIPDVPAESADNVRKVTGQHINTEIAVENCNLSTATTTRLPRPWPTKFIFPAYALRAGVVQKLESGEQLSRADRSQVTDAIYNEVTKYTYKSYLSIALRKGSEKKDDYSKITVSDLKNVNKVEEILKSDKGYKFLKQIRGTPPYWQATQKDVVAMVRQIGMPTYFLSFSSADLRWEEIMKTLLSQTGDQRKIDELE